jgi:outer membrane protein assembly factor BamB
MKAREHSHRIPTRGTFRLSVSLAWMTWLILAGSALAQSPTGKDDWPQFLGPQRTGISTETGLLDRWPDAGLKEIWRVPGGTGMSGIVISRGRLVTLMQRDGEQKLLAINALTGETDWETPLGNEFRNNMGNGPRATPAIAGDLVFAYTGEGILAAVQFTTGQLVWSHNVVKDLKGRVAEYGMTSSPLVVDNRVHVIVGAPRATVAAYDTTSGELAWTTGDDSAGYSSPAMLNVGGRRQMVVCTGASILGLQPDTGTVLWRHPYETTFDCNVATPLAVKGQVFVSSGENHGSVLLSLKPAGTQFEVQEVWKSLGTKSVLRNEWQTSILRDGYLYGFDNVGAAGPVTHLTCINAATGDRAWQKLRFGKGNMISADGKLFMSTVHGEVVIARATINGYEEIGRATVLKSTRQAPSLANGLLYLRDDHEILCLDVRRQSL